MNISLIKNNWASRGFSCDLWTDPPGQVWENYVHDVDELLMILEGEVELEMQGQKMCPKKKEEILISAHVMHSVRNKGSVASKWLYGYRNK
ncbi:MAG: cupin domain-containing protein [Chlamydiae bacterium]|nr:cupin domain-containing protein [Chlamydiota bacterium]MBI3277269.1 cupin domain-containing protein [Chlamydiota bacterium]